MSDLNGLQPGADAPLATGAGGCWNQIGTSGDGSCPELRTHIHCRNCPVFASAARTFFSRPAPAGYLEEWTCWLAESPGTNDSESCRSIASDEQDLDRDLVSVLVFRLGPEWLAFRTQTVTEVTLPRPVHRIPHRSSKILIGLVNLRGQLQLCVSLHGLLGVDIPDGPSHDGSISHLPRPPVTDGKVVASTPLTISPGPRLVVLRDQDRSETWIFAAEEVLGVHRLSRSQLRGVPSSLANPDVSFSQAILSWKDRSVAFLDEQRVFAALRSIGQ